MSKKLFAMLFITALFGVSKLHAQLYVGIEAGANRNYLVSNTADKAFYDYQPSNGYSVGVPIRYAFPKLSWFGGIQAVPSFVQKNYRIQRTGYYAPMYQQNTNSYIQLPVMAQFRFGGRINKAQTLHGILNLGGYGGYWLTGHVEGRALSPMDPINYQSFDEKYTFSSEKDRRIELGGVAGIGLQYMPTKKYVFSIEGRYTPSFTDQQKAYSENQVPRYNDTYGLMVGVQYQLR
ncbi:MAG TPA: porin family protein [Chitinophagaceae bacterium]